MWHKILDVGQARRCTAQAGGACRARVRAWGGLDGLSEHKLVADIARRDGVAKIVNVGVKSSNPT